MLLKNVISRRKPRNLVLPRIRFLRFLPPVEMAKSVMRVMMTQGLK